MSTAQLIAFADREGVELPTTDPALLFDFADLADFLEAFRAAHQVITTADDFTRVTYDGVRAAAIIALVPRLSAGCAKFPTVTI